MSPWDLGQILLWLVVLFNLLLTFGLVRRLGGLQEATAAARSVRLGGMDAGLRAPDFTATTPDGTHVASAHLAGQPTVLGFFSPTCAACEDHLPDFAAFGRRAGEQGVRAVAVVDGDPAESAALRRAAGPSLRVLLAPRTRNALLDAYRVEAFPSYTAIGEDGVVAGSFGAVPDLDRWLVTARRSR
jgi:peroxiredoxin